MEREYVITPDSSLDLRDMSGSQFANRDVLTAVAFLESMGLPQPMLSATRKQVEQGKLDFSTSLEYKMYSRHDKPVEE